MKNSLVHGVAALLVMFSALARAEEQSPQVTVVVGNRLPAERGADDAQPSPLTSPFGIDFDSRGEMVIVELEGGRVHRLDVNGELRTIAGDGSKTYTGDGGPARHATFNGMHNVAISKTDDVYIADSWNHCIRKITAATGEITTFAGTGEAGFSGDGGPAAQATFDFVMCITFDPSCAQLYIADLNNRRIRAIDMQTNLVRTVAGNGEQGVPQDGAVAVESPLVDPRAVTADVEANVYVLERGGHALRVVTPDGRIRTVAGTGERGFRDGPADAAQFDSPKHVCLDDRGCVYIADDRNAAIRKYDPRSQLVSTILGRGEGDRAIRLKNPHGVAFERGGLYVVDMGHNRILRLE
jgi:hypothetical protein